MESKNNETVNVEAESSKSTVSSQQPQWPKNCVGLVGKIPVFLGQQHFITHEQATGTRLVKESEGILFTQRKSGNSLSQTKASDSVCATSSAHVTTKLLSQPSLDSTQFGASHAIKELVNRNLSTELDKSTATSIVSKKFEKGLLLPKPVACLAPTPEVKLINKSQSILPKQNSHAEIGKLTGKSQPFQKIVTPIYSQFSMNKSANAAKSQIIVEGLISHKKQLPSGSFSVNVQGKPVNFICVPMQPNVHYVNVNKVQEKSIGRSVFQKLQIPNREMASSSNVDKQQLIKTFAAPRSISLLKGGQLSDSGDATGLTLIPKSNSQELPVSQIAFAQPAKKACILVRKEGFNSEKLSQTAHAQQAKNSCILLSKESWPTSLITISNSSPQPSPVLKTILSKPGSSGVALHSSSRSRFCSPSFSLNTSLKINNNIPDYRSMEVTQKDAVKMAVSVKSGLNHCTSSDSLHQGKPVMVMRPVLEPGSDWDVNATEVLQTKEIEVNNTNNLFLPTAVDQIGQFYSEKDVEIPPKGADEIESIPSNIKIQSVFSLADKSSLIKKLCLEENKRQALDTEVEHISDSDDCEIVSESEEESTFNVFEGKWKTVCPSAYVVLERLHPEDIKDLTTGNRKASVQCSHHCRVRTLSYLCELNLMPCENRPQLKDTACDKETDLSLEHISFDVKEPEKKAVSKDERQEGITETLACLMKDGEGEQSVNIDRGEKENGGAHLDASSSTEVKQDSQVFTKMSTSRNITNNEMEDINQMELNLISLKRQVEEKRCRMRIEKRQHKIIQTRMSRGKANDEKMAVPSKAMEESRHCKEKLPVVLGSLLKSRGNVSSQSNPKKISTLLRKKGLSRKYLPSISTSSATNSASLTARSPREEKSSLTSGSTPPLTLKKKLLKTNIILELPAQYAHIAYGKSSRPTTTLPTKTSPVVSSSASAVFSVLKAKESSPTSNSNSNTTTTSSKPKVLLPLQKVHNALRSLAKQLKSTGQVIKGAQYVMIKIDNTPLLLKLNPDALEPKNIDSLGISSMFPQASSSTQVEKTKQGLALQHSTPITISSKSMPKRSSFQSTLPSSMPSTSKPFKKVILTNQNSSTRIQSQPSHEKSSSSTHTSFTSGPTSFSKNIPTTAIRNIQKTTTSTVTSPSSSANRIVISSVHSGQSALNVASTSTSLRSLLSTSSGTYSDIDSNCPLTHIPSTSALLPEKRKRQSDHLSKEERNAKRRALEEKYPLPPGLVIKCEPDDYAEYNIDNNWLVTSEIHTGYSVTTDPMDDGPQNTYCSKSGDADRISMDNEHSSDAGKNFDSDSESVEITGSPPPLDSIFSTGMDIDPKSPSPDVDDVPPVLQPMPSFSVQQVSEIDKVESSQRSVASSRPSLTHVYDSGYDSVGPSSSFESLSSVQVQDKQPGQQLSKIQQLKELLRQKELHVENMLKKKSELPEMDLNAL